ncbi:nitrite/sulfite reductase, partial [Clostridioides difficile]
HCSIQDLGFVATLKNDEPYFRVFLGGGLGKQPKVALELDELIPRIPLLQQQSSQSQLQLHSL